MALEKVSVTELIQFRDCRRAWYLSKIQALEPRIPQSAFWFGTGMHKALEAYYKATDDPVETALKAYAKWYVQSEPELSDGYGMLWQDAQAEYIEMFTLGQEIISNYAEYDAETEGLGTPIMIEKRAEIEIRPPHSDPFLLTGKMDLLTQKANGVSVVDHKTAKRRMPMSEFRDIDDQGTGYAYMCWRTTGEVPVDVVFNTLVKDVPKEVDINKDGSPSKRKDQSTTHAKYLAVLEERGLSTYGYLEILDALRARGWSNWFSREWTQRNMTQIINYELRLYHIVRDMRDVMKNPDRAYPSPSQIRCPYCPYLAVCHAMEDGSDYKSLIEAHFKSSTREEVLARNV